MDSYQLQQMCNELKALIGVCTFLVVGAIWIASVILYEAITRKESGDAVIVEPARPNHWENFRAEITTWKR